jgi:hypothetical protein
MLTKKILLPFLLLLCYSGITLANEPVEIDLDLAKSQAILHASDRFKADGYQWQRYRMTIDAGSRGIEVIFVPPAMTGNDPWTAKPSTLPEVHYYLDAKGQTILRKLLGK